jgi:heme exporter protein C
MRLILLCLSFCLIVISGLLACSVAVVEPVEYNIIYIHVPAGICSLACFTVLFICSLAYLRTKNLMWDNIAAACGEVGFVFATALNATGSIFAYATWGTWWTPSLRLISSAMLWFLYVAYLILRAGLSSQQRKGQICSVFGIIAFVDVPLVYISARFIPDIHWPNFTFESGWQNAAFILAIIGTLLLAAILIWIRADMLKNLNQISNIKNQNYGIPQF